MDNSSFNPHIEKAEISKVVLEKFEPERSDSESVRKVKSQISLDRFRSGGNESSSTQINTAVQLNYNESGFTAEGKAQLNMLREFKKGERELEKLKAQKLSSNDTKRKSDVEKQITKLDTELKDLSLKLEKDFKSKTGIEGNFLEIPLEDINELINLPTEHKFTKSEEFEKYISKTDAKQKLGKDEAPPDLSTQPIAHKKANEVARRQLTRGNNVNSYEGSKKDKLSLGAVKEKISVNNESIVVSSEKTKTVLPKKQVFNQNTGSVTSKITDGSDEGSKTEKLHNSSNKIDKSILKEKIKETPRALNELIDESEAKKEKSSTVVSRDNRHNNLFSESNIPDKTSKIIVGTKATRPEKLDKAVNYKIETSRSKMEEEVADLPFNKEIFDDLVKKTNSKSEIVSQEEVNALKKLLMGINPKNGANLTIVQTLISSDNVSLKDLAAELGMVTTDVFLYTFKKLMTTRELLKNVLISLKDSNVDIKQKKQIMEFCTQIVNSGFYNNDFINIPENVLLKAIIDVGKEEKIKEVKNLENSFDKIFAPNNIKEKNELDMEILFSSIPATGEYESKDVKQFASRITNLQVKEFLKADISEFLQDKLLDGENDHLTPHLKKCLDNRNEFTTRIKNTILKDPSSVSFFIDLANEFKKNGDLSNCVATISIMSDSEISKATKEISTDEQKEKIKNLSNLIFQSGYQAAIKQLGKEPYLMPINTVANLLTAVNSNKNNLVLKIYNDRDWPNIKKLGIIKNIIDISLLKSIEFNKNIES